MFLRVTFSSYNSFLLCVFFPERLGPKARFSDYNVSPFTPFFISQNTRNICKTFFALFVSKPNVNMSLPPASQKIPGSFAAGAAEENEQGSLEPPVMNATCFLWPLMPVPPPIPPPLSASIKLWYGFMVSCWCFQMPLLMFAPLFFGDQRVPFFFSKLRQQPRWHLSRSVLCILHC